MRRKSSNTAQASASAPPAKAEALSWPIGLAFLVVLAMTYSAGVWWMARGMSVQARTSQMQTVEAVADNLVTALEPLLASGDLSAARRLLTEASYQNDFDICQLVLSDGRSLVDADLSRPQLTVMPANWSGTSMPLELTRVIDGRLTVDRPIQALGRGDATLTIETPLASTATAFHAVAPGAGAVGALGLIGMLLIYRQIRSRLQTLNLIRNALISAGEGGETCETALLNPRMGREALGWNKLLNRQQMQEQAKTADELEQLSQIVGGGGALEIACDAIWHGMLVVDPSGRVIYANGAAASLMGQSDPDQAVGELASDWLTDASVREAIDKCVAGNAPARTTLEIVRTVGESQNYLRVTLRRLGGAERGGVLILIEDITQNRMADLSRHDFVARATHELRSPLTNIRLYVETAQDEGEHDAQLRGECLNVISRESQRLERLVGEMLSVSEIEAGSQQLKQDDVRLDAVFKEVQANYEGAAKEKQIELTFDLPPKFPVIRGDREKLDVVLQNLLGNAIKYTPEGGEVTFRVEVSPTELLVEVSDTGIGIGEADLPKVFEKFYRANDARLGEITGSGLGLALAQEIVRQHGGELTVESELNEGSTFRMKLPIRAEGV